MLVTILWIGSIVATFIATLFVVKNNPKILSAVGGFNSFVDKVKKIK